MFYGVNSLGFGFYDYSIDAYGNLYLIAPYSNTVDGRPGPNVLFF